MCYAVTDPIGLAVVGNDLRNVSKAGAKAGAKAGRVNQYALANQNFWVGNTYICTINNYKSIAGAQNGNANLKLSTIAEEQYLYLKKSNPLTTRD